MPVVLNRAGYNHALSLIKAGKVDKTSSWSISADDENKILGDPPNWDEYKKWHLGYDTGENPETKAAWKYPFGKNGKLYRSALIAIRQRAAQQGVTDIFNAAGRLLAQLEPEAAHDETGWIPIFQTGTWTDSSGITRTWTEKDLDEIAESYDPAWHEAPVVIGHPKEDAPAYGWVEKLKRVGNVLYAKLKDVVPEFKELVNKGAFKKRSVALSRAIKDGVWYLRHIGFLGAVPPAVKGLADVKLFHEAGDSVLEISFSQEDKMSDIEKVKAELHEQIKKEIEAQFTEQIKKEKEEKERLAKEIAELQRKLKRAELEKFIDQLMSEGKVTPAMKEQGIIEFMLQLDSETEIEFAEGQKKSQLAYFKDFLNNLPKIVEFKEIATKDKVPGQEPGKVDTRFADRPVDPERLELHQKALAYMKEHKVSYEEAIQKVST